VALDVEVKARVSQGTKEKLARIAHDRGEGVKISNIVREAIQEYLARNHSSAGPVTYLRAAEADEPSPRTGDGPE
jgi:predicted transcriptional regulator